MVDTTDIIVDINRNDIKIKLGGGFLTDIASVFEIFFKGTVVNLIRDAVETTLRTVIPKATNKALLDNDGYFHFIEPVWYDWESPSAAVVSNDAW